MARDLPLVPHRKGRSFFFNIIVVSSLAIGIGSATAVLTGARELLWRKPPYPEPERLVTLQELAPDGKPSGVALQNLLDWKDQSTSFETMAAFRLRSFGLRAPAQGAKPVVIQVGLVTSDFFATLGTALARGRSFTAEEELSEAPVIVLTQELASRFGTEVLLNEQPRAVVGVLPEGFRFPMAPGYFPGSGSGLAPEAFIPLSHRDYGGKRAVRSLGAIARLEQSVPLETARAELEEITARLASAYPDTNRGFGASTLPLSQTLTGTNREPFRLLAAAVLALFGIVVANLGSLFLADLLGRGREVAVRISLGAGRGDLFAAVFMKTLVPSVVGAALGLFLARLAVGALPEVLSLFGGFTTRELSLGWEAYLFALTAATVAAALLAVLVVRLASGANVTTLLKRGTLAGPTPLRLRRMLVVVQVGLAVLLLQTTGLLDRSFRALSSVDPGFATTGRFSFGLGLPEIRYDSEEKLYRFHETLLERLRAIPGVDAAGAGSGLRLSGQLSLRGSFRREDSEAPRNEWPTVSMRLSSPGYFESLGAPFLQGRSFAVTDDSAHSRVVLVNRAFQRAFFPEEDPVGARIALSWRSPSHPDGALFEIVGVVADLRQVALSEPPAPEIVLPLSAFPPEGATYVLRTSRRDASFGTAVRAAVDSVDPELETLNLRPLAFWVEESVAEQRLSRTLSSVLGLAAAALAALGIYGVLAYSVMARRREIAIRSALGADRSRLERLISWDGLRLVLWGLATGVAAFALLTPLLENRLFAVRPLDPAAIAGTLVGLALVALLGCWQPSRRASRVSFRALRED